MEKVLHYYYSAQKDVRLNSTPYRKPDGTYHWCNGQLEILNEEKFKQLRTNYTDVEQLTTHKNSLRRKILSYQNPTSKLTADGEHLSANFQPEIDEEEMNYKSWDSQIKHLDEDLLNRGITISEKKANEQNKKPVEKKKNNGFTFKTFFSFLAIWIVGEIFMTYVQWNGLRNDKGVEDMVVRSLSFGVILFLVHLVAHFNRKHRQKIYQVFIGFSLFMLITMLFAPLIINKAYPESDTVPGGSQQWSLTKNTTPQSSKSTTPFWIEFYHENEMIPAILCFLFFVAMQSFMNSKQKKTAEESIEPEEKLATVYDQVLSRRNYMLEKRNESKIRLNELKTKQKNDLADNTGDLKIILAKLESMKNECVEIDKKITDTKTTSEVLLTELEKELTEYSIEYLDVLKNDEVKNSFVIPEWPTRQDVISRFKNQTV